jgi:hypothetical protein
VISLQPTAGEEKGAAIENRQREDFNTENAENAENTEVTEKMKALAMRHAGSGVC